ncbi:polysaccharide lyase 8 family protein [Streptomyces liangshanensis]|uniref:polysaccharide lyase 8 family protein n=1 Tax=Streptomyces liangshanensis TaxID=2717324 RepID=UPI0036D7E425
MPWPRRHLLAAAAATAAAALGRDAHASEGPSQADPLDTLRTRWTTLHLGTAYIPTAEPYASRLARTGARADRYRRAMAPTPTSLWPDHPFDPPAGPAGLTAGHARLLTMAEAYTQPGTGLTGDPALLDAVLRGLDHLAATVYHPGTTPYGNWWEWRIGTPRHLLDTVAVLYDHLTPQRREAACAAVDHFVPDTLLTDYSGVSTGANRVDLCRVVALRGVLGRAPGKIALARDALSPVFPYVTKGDGLHADGSFVQHTWVAYSGTYGQVLLDGLGRLFTLLAGSPWAVTDPDRQIVLDSVERAYAPLVLDGLMMDSVSGRAVSRGHLKDDDLGVLRGDHFHGRALIAAIPLLMSVASPAERTRWTARAKGWIERSAPPGGTSPVLTAPEFGVADLARLHTLAASGVPAAPEPAGHTLFPGMDRAVHRRPGWTANLAMASDRIASYECGNGENPRGWHTGAGMLYWWRPGTDANHPAEDNGDPHDAAHRPNDQYTDWFWPTVDPYRLPGTTVSTRRLPDRAGGEWGAPRPAVRWVGGVTDGTFASVGQHLKGLGSTLDARTSWIFAADAVVCLGAGITSTDGVPVETIVDNRNLGASGRHLFTLDPAPRPRWAHLAGHGGWVFPGGAPPGTLRTLEEARTGSWSDINTAGATARRTRRYRTLWLDHGTDPVAASYRYLLMPGASPRALAARAADPHWLSLLAHTADAQAVAIRSLGLTAANLWRAGTAGPLTVTAPASVLVVERGRTATIHVSEPVRSGQPVEVVWDRPVRRAVAADPSVEVLAAGRTVRLRITPGTRGESHRCDVTLRGAAG